MHRLSAAAALLLASCVVACGSDDPALDGADAAPVASVTYYRDIKPIIDAKCIQCHFDGGIAPFSLESFDGAKAHAGVASLAIESNLMPPWPPDDTCNEYVGDRSLDEAQKALFQQWVDEGSAEGDAANPGPALEVEHVALSRVDATLGMDDPYAPSIDPSYSDDYRCFLIPWPAEYTATKYVSGFRAVPGNPSLVHHVIAYLAAPGQVATYQQLDADEPGAGYTCFGGTGGPSRTMIGGWAPGSLGQDMPAGTGIPVQAGSMVILQVHYNTANAAEAVTLEDQTAIEVKLDDTVEKPAQLMPWANPQWLSSQTMEIPANEPDATHSFQYDATVVTGGAFRVYGIGLHMHTLGTRTSMTIERADGNSECLLRIEDWNFHWQGNYGLRDSVVFNPGDELKIECHWDNTSPNQALGPDGEPRTPQDVYWGEGTTDEMCVGFLYVTAP